MGKQRKDPAAIALGRKGAQARLTSLSAEQRSAQARKAVQTRWAKASGKQPIRWWGLFSVNGPNPPEPVFWSRDKAEVRAWGQQHPEHFGFMDFVEGYYPRVTIVAEFKPDVAAQVMALRAVLDEERG
jgi:hypothetical protein